MAKQKTFDKQFPYKMLGFDMESAKASGEELIGTCPFCCKSNKLYVNAITGQFSCKGGTCGKEGNHYTFVRTFYEEVGTTPVEDVTCRAVFATLALNRGFEVADLVHFGIKWADGIDRFLIPLYDERGIIINLLVYKPGLKAYSLSGMNLCVGGTDKWVANDDKNVYLCEGPWDAIAMDVILAKAEETGLVLWMPGANTFKDGSEKFFKGRNVFCLYDNDIAGQKGRAKVSDRLKGIAKSLMLTAWPKELPSGFDLRDFHSRDGDLEKLRTFFFEFELAGNVVESDVVELPPLVGSERMPFSEVLKVFEKHMKLTDDMRMGIKLICAVHQANNVRSIPLWIHIAGPPGSGKTEILMAFDGVPNVELRSTLTAKSLVSGFSLPGGRDPSLLPCLFGKTFILKDYTEVLQMQRQEKEEVDAILRGAYDGVVTKQFGNGILRHYEGTFNMVTGVTQEIFAEARTSLGERFLLFHMVKGVGFNNDEIIRAALSNSGNEAKMRAEMGAAVRAFLSFSFTEKDIPDLPLEYVERIVSLSQVVAVLRANVTRDYREEKILFRPQHEIGTRLAKQMKITLQCLGICNCDRYPEQYDYDVVARLALDSCKGLNLEIAQFVAEHPECTARDIADSMKLPMTSIRQLLDDLELLSVIEKTRKESEGVGQPAYGYEMTPNSMRNWEGAGLARINEIKSIKPPVKMKFKKLRAAK